MTEGLEPLNWRRLFKCSDSSLCPFLNMPVCHCKSRTMSGHHHAVYSSLVSRTDILVYSVANQ
jgi:hypothetical protein